MKLIHISLVLFVCSFITLASTKSTVVYRRYHRKRPDLRKTHKSVVEIVEVFKTNRKPPAFLKSDKSIEKFLLCDAKCERKRFLKRRKMCLRTGRYCPTRPSRPTIKPTINVSTRPIYNKPTIYDRNPFGNQNPDYTHLYPWSRPSVTVTKYPPNGSKNFNMTIVEVNNDTIATPIKDDYEYYDTDNDDRQQYRRSTTLRVPTTTWELTKSEFSTTEKTIETTTNVPSTTVTNAPSPPTTTSMDTISSSTEYFLPTTETITLTTLSRATEVAWTEATTIKTRSTFPTTTEIDISTSTELVPDENRIVEIQPDPINRIETTTEYLVTSTAPQTTITYVPNTVFPAIETLIPAERSTTETSTTERSTTEKSTTERSTTEKSTTERSTTERSTTERSTTERSTTERSTTEISTTDRSTTHRSTTESTTSTTENLTREAATNAATNIPTTLPTTTQPPIITTPTSTYATTTESSSNRNTTQNLADDNEIEETTAQAEHNVEEDYIEEYEEGEVEENAEEEGEEGGEEAGDDENGEGEDEGDEENGNGATYDYDDDGNYDEEE